MQLNNELANEWNIHIIERDKMKNKSLLGWIDKQINKL